jgi:long-chain fatty acid transport protein
VTVTPTAWTQIGLGYRSAIDQSINGSFTTNGFGGTPGPIATTVKLPDSVNLGIRQGLTPWLTLLGTAEWTNWRRIGTSFVTQGNGAPALAPSGNPVTVPFQWKDGWFYSVGAEYVAGPTWTFRGGVGFEQSPVTDQVRIPLLPDNDRTWYSVGATNKVTNIISVDLAYSFVDVKNATVNVVPGNPSFNGLVTYTGTAHQHLFLGREVQARRSAGGRYARIACPGREAGVCQARLRRRIVVEEGPRLSIWQEAHPRVSASA